MRWIAGQAAFADCRAVRGAAVEQSLALGTERKGHNVGRSPGTNDRVCGAVGLRRRLADVEVPSADGAEVVLTACRQHDWSDMQATKGMIFASMWV